MAQVDFLLGFHYDLCVFLPGLVNVYITMERSTMLLMGKLTISMPFYAHFQ